MTCWGHILSTWALMINTSIAVGLSLLKHVGPTNRFDRLYITHRAYSGLSEFIPKFMSPMTNQWEDSLCNALHKSEKDNSKL